MKLNKLAVILTVSLTLAPLAAEGQPTKTPPDRQLKDPGARSSPGS